MDQQALLVVELFYLFVAIGELGLDQLSVTILFVVPGVEESILSQQVEDIVEIVVIYDRAVFQKITSI